MTEPNQKNTKATRDRDAAQDEQLRAQARGDTGDELKAFAKELVADHVQFPGDVVADARDPERREDEEQGTVVHPESEPHRA